jgi:hypothetical protein
MAPRIIVRIELTSSAKNALGKLTAKHGMTQVAMLSRLTEWLARQPQKIRASVMGQAFPEGGADTGELILKEMAAGRKS